MQLPVGLLPQNPKARDQAYAQVNGMGVRAPEQASGHSALTMISEALGKGAKICRAHSVCLETAKPEKARVTWPGSWAGPRNTWPRRPTSSGWGIWSSELLSGLHGDRVRILKNGFLASKSFSVRAVE